MPQIKPLSISNGSATVVYSPAASNLDTTQWVNRGQSLSSVSKITNKHQPIKQGAAQWQTLSLDKKKEVQLPSGELIISNIGLYELKIANDPSTSTKDERRQALNELINLLQDPDIITSIVENESFY